MKIGKYKARLFEMLRHELAGGRHELAGAYNSLDEAKRLVHHANSGFPFMSHLQSYHLSEALLPGITLDEANDWSPVFSATENRLMFLSLIAI